MHILFIKITCVMCHVKIAWVGEIIDTMVELKQRERWVNVTPHTCSCNSDLMSNSSFNRL